MEEKTLATKLPYKWREYQARLRESNLLHTLQSVN